MDNIKPAAEALAGVLPANIFEEIFQKPGRGPQKEPTKERITIRLSPEVLDAYRATGKGWQSRIDDDLKELISKDKAA